MDENPYKSPETIGDKLEGSSWQSWMSWLFFAVVTLAIFWISR